MVMFMSKEFSLDGILWFPINELNQAMKEVYPKIPRSEVLYRKTCLYCGRKLPKYKSKYCSNKHREFYKNKKIFKPTK